MSANFNSANSNADLQVNSSCNLSGRFDSPFIAERVLKKVRVRRKYAKKHCRLNIRHCRQCGGYHIRSESKQPFSLIVAKARSRRTRVLTQG